MMLIGKILYYIFLTVVVTITVLLVVSVLPVTGNIKFLTVLSGSMEPAIKTGSVVMVKPMPAYNAGDIVTFGPNTKTKPPTTHRIIEVSGSNGQTEYRTKGDANNAPDLAVVVKREIIGKVIVSVPYAGYAVAAARKPYGFFLIVIIPALLIIWDETSKIIAELKKRKTANLK